MSESDRRVSERFTFQGSGIGSVNFGEHLVFPMLNLSYGGLAIEVTDLQSGALIEKMQNQNVTLTLLGSSVVASISFANKRMSAYGLVFCHDDPRTLIFLRKSLEFMRRGATLSVIDSKSVQEKFRDGKWTCFRGEGPTDLVIENLESASTYSFYATFRDKMDYHNLHWNAESGLRASTNLDQDHRSAPRMGQISPKEYDCLKKVTCLAIGLSQNDDFSSKLVPMITMLVSEILSNKPELPRLPQPA